MIEKIKSRLPGGLNAQAFNLAIKNLVLGKFDRFIDRQAIIGYFMGRVGAGYSQIQIYHQLEKKWTEDDHFNFNGVKIPKVQTNREKEIFVYEFLDFVYPYLASRNRLLGEGPYFYSKVQIIPGDVIIDAGANIGMFSALASKLGGIVYAFEPVEEIRQKYLAKTSQLNPNIHIVPMALSDKTGETIIKVDKNNLGGSSICMKRKYSNEETILAITLDDWVKENGISKVDFIKSDIEGAERLMLKGAQNVLRIYTPKLAICTYHLPDDKEILTNLILEANSQYKIQYKWEKLYANV